MGAPNGYSGIRTFLLSSPPLLGRFHPQLLYSRPCDRACHGAKWGGLGCHLSLTNDGTFWLILLLDVFFFFFLGGMGDVSKSFFLPLIKSKELVKINECSFVNKDKKQLKTLRCQWMDISRPSWKYKLYTLAAWCGVGNTKTSSTSYKVTRIWPYMTPMTQCQ